jgi:hypothetical protein
MYATKNIGPFLAYPVPAPLYTQTLGLGLKRRAPQQKRNSIGD